MRTLVLLLAALPAVAQMYPFPGPKNQAASGGGGGGVTLDNIGAGASPCCSGTTATAAHTITNGLTNTAMIALVGWQQDSSTVSGGCTWNGTTMTPVPWNFRETIVNFQGTAAFVLATGTGDGVSHNVVCSMGGTIANGVGLITISVTGANQTTPARSSFTTQIDSSSPAVTSVSLNVSNAASGDFVIDCLSITNSAASTTTKTDTANLRKVNVGGNSWSVQASYALATGATTMGYSFPGTGFFMGYGAVAIRP